jgi:hypothetical protein
MPNACCWSTLSSEPSVATDARSALSSSVSRSTSSDGRSRMVISALFAARPDHPDPPTKGLVQASRTLGRWIRGIRRANRLGARIGVGRTCRLHEVDDVPLLL